MDISYRIPKAVLPALLVGALALNGCKSNETKADATPQAADQTSQKSESAKPAEQPAPVAQKPICKEEPKTNSKKTKGKKASASQPVDCVPADQAAAPAAVAAQAPSASGHYDLSKNKPISDSSTAEAGKGTAVKGIDGWEGEISGLPAPGSKFTRLKIGMSTDEVFRLIGQPSGQSSYPTGKSHIPFYHGADRWRQEAIYRGQGRLIFSEQGGWGGSGYNLIWIIHCANEQ
jgi:hypothetical protein